MRVEWSKANARALRYAEEEELVLEEMRRVRQYFFWRSRWWREEAGQGRLGVSVRVKEGCLAYAHKQASLLDALRSKFTMMWQTELHSLDIPSDFLVA